MTDTFYDTCQSFQNNADGLFLRSTQGIPSEFLDDLRTEREDKIGQRSRDYERVASVPTHVIDIWLKGGRDVWNAKPSEIVRWLKQDGLDAFITTPKRV